MPVDEQTHLDQAWSDDLFPTLNGRPPVCVLLLLADVLVPLWDPKTPGFRGGELGTEFGLKGSKITEGIVEMVIPSPSLTTKPSSALDLCGIDEDRVSTGKEKLNDGTSGGIVARRGFSSRLLEDQSASVDFLLKTHRVLVTGSLPFLGSSLGGSHSVSRQDLYLNSSAVKSDVLLPTILEGTPLDFSDLKLKL
jgi:hypothetical protein